MQRSASTFAAVVAAILAHLLGNAAHAKTGPEAATLTLIEPAFDSSYGKVIRVAAALDGRSLGECSTDPPPDKNVCIAPITSPIPAAERLHRLAELDCAPTRHSNLRGKTLEPFLRSDFPDADPALQGPLKAEFAACLSAVKP